MYSVIYNLAIVWMKIIQSREKRIIIMQHIILLTCTCSRTRHNDFFFAASRGFAIMHN